MGRPRRRTRARDAGFTLLEVLVAFIIAAIALSVLFRAAAENEAAAGIAGRYQEALSRARSRLAALDAAPLVTASDQQGDDGGGYTWRVRVSPLATAPGSPAARGPALFAVGVAVAWVQGGRARTVELDTRRVGLAPPRAP